PTPLRSTSSSTVPCDRGLRRRGRGTTERGDDVVRGISVREGDLHRQASELGVATVQDEWAGAEGGSMPLRYPDAVARGDGRERPRTLADVRAAHEEYPPVGHDDGAAAPRAALDPHESGGASDRRPPPSAWEDSHHGFARVERRLDKGQHPRPASLCTTQHGHPPVRGPKSPMSRLRRVPSSLISVPTRASGAATD